MAQMNKIHFKEEITTFFLFFLSLGIKFDFLLCKVKRLGLGDKSPRLEGGKNQPQAPKASAIGRHIAT